TTRVTTPARGTNGRATSRCRPKRPSNSLLLAAFGGVEKRRAELSAERVPAADALARFRAQGRSVGDVLRILDEPALDLAGSHLGVELHAPDNLAEAIRLRGRDAASELDRARGRLVAVVVPLEGGEPCGEPAEHRIV